MQARALIWPDGGPFPNAAELLEEYVRSGKPITVNFDRTRIAGVPTAVVKDEVGIWLEFDPDVGEKLFRIPMGDEKQSPIELSIGHTLVENKVDRIVEVSATSTDPAAREET